MSEYEKKLAELSESYGNWFDGRFAAPRMTGELYPYREMFSPVRVNSVTIKNRLVMAPMGNIDMCEETGRPDARMLAYFEERAKGGVGLITTGLIPISYGVDNSITELGDLSYFPRIDRSRTVFSAWRDLAAALHAHGTTLFIQLTPGLGRVGNPQCLVNSLKFPVSASMNPNFYIADIPCLRLSDGKCRKIIKNAGQAAADAKAANIDGVYLHGHEGYLLEQMTNTAFNRRAMGRYADWQRFGIDTVKEIRARAGAKFPIMYRIDLSLMLNETYGGRMDKLKALKKFKKERTPEQTLEYMKNLVAAGVDMFDVDLGCYDNWWLPHPPASMPSGCFLDVAEIVKKYFADNGVKANSGLPVPVVAVGKLGYPDLAEQALRDGKCDMVMLGRPLLADPQWPNKAYAGRVDEIRPCIGCQEACLNEFVEGGHPQCAVNPRTAFECEYDAELQPAPVKKKVAVVGAGPAGITAAEVLVRRGHTVELLERDKRVGGSLVPGSVAKIKYEFGNYLDYLRRTVQKLEKEANFTLKLGADVSAATLKKGGYDAILVAAGGRQSPPPVEGIERDNVHFAVDVLNDPQLVADAKKVVVIGGGVVGCETAYWLSYELKKDVKVVEMDRYIMNHSCTANRGHIIHYLEKNGVELLNCTALKKVNEHSVTVSRNVSPSVNDPYNTWQPILPENVVNPLAPKLKTQLEEQELQADAVVVAAGVRSNNELYYECVADNAAAEVWMVGDAYKSGKVFEAVRSAYKRARTI